MIENGVVNGRFQVLHLKHMEYILAAKMRCRKLYIGLSNPDGRLTGDSVNDMNRSTKAANPLTYFERYEMIKGAMREFKVPEEEYEIMPFPINFPEYISNYMPKDATYFLGLSDGWDEEKYKVLRSLKLDVEVLWRREEKERGVSASWVRSCIATDEEWAHLVPKSVCKYLTQTHLVDRIKHLEKIRIEEKMVL